MPFAEKWDIIFKSKPDKSLPFKVMPTQPLAPKEETPEVRVRKSSKKIKKGVDKKIKVSKCKKCGAVFKNAQALGGHVSKAHSDRMANEYANY